jgi:hypothetical protein
MTRKKEKLRIIRRVIAKHRLNSRNNSNMSSNVLMLRSNFNTNRINNINHIQDQQQPILLASSTHKPSLILPSISFSSNKPLRGSNRKKLKKVRMKRRLSLY